MKNKYPELFDKKYHPLYNIFISNLLKDEKSYLNTFSKDAIPLIENNKSLILKLQNSNQSGSHWLGVSKKIATFLYLIHSGFSIYQKMFMKYIIISILLQIYIEFNISVQIYVDYFLFYSVYIKLIVKTNS